MAAPVPGISKLCLERESLPEAERLIAEATVPCKSPGAAGSGLIRSVEMQTDIFDGALFTLTWLFLIGVIVWIVIDAGELTEGFTARWRR